MQRPKKLPASFYATRGGTEPVREWLRGLDEGDRRTIGRDIALAEYGWPIGMPTCRAMGRGLYEIRSRISAGRIARVIFFVSGPDMVLLHGFVKKSQRTPKSELDLAVRRLKEYERHG